MTPPPASRHPVAPLRSGVLPAVLSALLVGLGGCTDLPTEVEELTLVASEIGGALGGPLPVPPHLVRFGLGPVEDERLDLWSRSWDTGDEEVRARMRSALAAELAESGDLGLLSRETERLDARLDLVAERARLLPAWSGLPAVIEGARSDLSRAADPEIEAAFRWESWLRVGDRLWPWVPERRARLLFDRCVARRTEVAHTYGERTSERIDDMLGGVEAALERGESLLALRRAWYGCRLVERAAAEVAGPGSPDANGGFR